jgi:hypothetical protein
MMNRREEKAFNERQRVARELWQMVKTGLGNAAGADNPFLTGALSPVEIAYPWIRERPDD